MIDLDNLGKPSQPVTNAGGELGLVFVGKSTLTNKPATSVSLPELYKRKKKLVYLIDRSGSMNCQVAGSDQVKYFYWSPETMATIEANVKSACRVIEEWNKAEAKFNGTFDDTVFDGLVAPSSEDSKWSQLEDLEGDELKRRLLQLNLNTVIGLPFDFTAYQQGRRLDSRLALVQKMAERMISERVKEFPDADTQVIAFDNEATLLPARTPAQLIEAVQRLEVGGSTSILRALKLALDECGRHPSEVKMHHFVLVTDGEDYDTMNIDKFVPVMLEMGVVLDWIFIANPGDTASRDAATMAIKAAVDATGGTFTIVTSAPEFETKFVEASTRKLLPAVKNS